MTSSTFLKNLKQFNDDLHQMTRISQLMDYISWVLLERVAFWLLAVWLVSPLYVLVRIIFDPAAAVSGGLGNPAVHASWLVILKVTGNLGLILMVIGLGKSALNARREGTSMKSYLGSHILPFCLGLMLVWSLLSTLLSNDFGKSFFGDGYRNEGFLTLLAYAGLFSCALLIRDRSKVLKLLGINSFVALLVGFHYLSNWRPELYHSNYYGIFMQFNHTAYYFCLAIFTSLTLFLAMKFTKKQLWLAIIWLFSFVVAIASLIINNSFGPYLAAIVGVLLAILFQPKQADKKQRFRLTLSVIIFVVISLGLNLWLNGIGKDFTAFINDIEKVTTGNESAGTAGSGRWRLWTVGFQLAFEKPIFGYGPDNLGAAYIERGVTYNDRPHNEFLYYAAAMGIPALLFYCIGLISHLVGFLKRHSQLDWLVVGIFCTVGAYLFSSVFGNTMFYTMPFYIISLGLSYSQLRFGAWHQNATGTQAKNINNLQ